MESIDRGAVGIEVAVGATQAAATCDGASEAVDAAVISAGTGSFSAVVGASGSIGQRPKVIVEGVVFLHHDDNVVDLCQIAVGKCQAGWEQTDSQGH